MLGKNPNSLLSIRINRIIRKICFSRDTSESGEYTLIKKLLKKDSPLYLVDVGAHNGKTLSNSYPFIRDGWKAIMIEPLPRVFKSLSNRYQGLDNVICINEACSNKGGKQKLFIGFDGFKGYQSTLCTDDNEFLREKRTDDYIMVEVNTLTDILIKNKFPKDFSLLCIDTEGMDYEVLLGLDFTAFQPRVIVTEEYMYKMSEKYQLLSDKGYTLKFSIGSNTIWLRD